MMNVILMLLAFVALAHYSSSAATVSCAPDLIARLRDAKVASLGYVGISSAELSQLITTGAIENKDAKHWPRFIEGQPEFRKVPDQKRRYEDHVDDHDVQLKAATLDAWARTAADVLNERHGAPAFTTEAYLTFVRGLANDLETNGGYSPKAVKIRRAAENSEVPITAKKMGRLRTIAKLLNVHWTDLDKNPGDFWRVFEAKLVDLPAAGGAVLGLSPNALSGLTWSARAAPYLKRIALDDLVSIAPAAPEGRELLDRAAK